MRLFFGAEKKHAPGSNKKTGLILKKVNCDNL